MADTAWGALDVLLVDLPPGTDRLSTIVGLLPALAGTVIVTIPSDVAHLVVRRSITAARAAPAPVLGVIENMAGMFAGVGAETLARESGVPFLGRVPFDAALTAALEAPPARPAWIAELAAVRAKWEASVAAQRASDLGPLHYARICTDVGEIVGAVDPEMPVLFDTGHLLSFAPPFLRASSRNVAHCGFYHRMGWSASALVGASLARGGSRALALIGDGSFLMGGMAVATAVEQDLPLTWIVLNNRSLQIERELMLRAYGREAFCDYRLKRTGELWNPDLCQWAQAMGAEATKVTEAKAFAPALRRALGGGRPHVIDVDVSLEIEGYRSVWYPYPRNFFETWAPGPLGRA
jgi:acetolactate synthase-1/2/3 large subunit